MTPAMRAFVGYWLCANLVLATTVGWVVLAGFILRWIFR